MHQVGDQLDRGNDEIQILYFLERLEREAERAGGKLHILNGNHETMNVAGRFNYATLPGLADFYQWQLMQSWGSALKVRAHIARPCFICLTVVLLLCRSTHGRAAKVLAYLSDALLMSSACRRNAGAVWGAVSSLGNPASHRRCPLWTIHQQLLQEEQLCLLEVRSHGHTMYSSCCEVGCTAAVTDRLPPWVLRVAALLAFLCIKVF